MAPPHPAAKAAEVYAWATGKVMADDGSVVSTVKDRDGESEKPTASVPRTVNVWGPSPSVPVVWESPGPEQGPNGSVSTLQAKVTGSLAENVKEGVASPVGPVGPESMLTTGPWVSTEKAREAGVPSVLPAGSVAWTSNVWGPSGSPGETVWGVVQVSKGSESIRHSNVEPTSSEENAKVGVSSFVGPVGPESMVVWGGVSSMVNVTMAVDSVLPASSVARELSV